MFRIIHYHRGQRRQIPLDPDKGSLTIGRHPESDVVIADGSVSRNHARVFLDDGGQPWIEDLESFNGTFIEGERVSRHQLESGVDIRCGEVHLIFICANTDAIARQMEEEFGWEQKSGEVLRKTTKPAEAVADGGSMRRSMEELVAQRRQVAGRHRELAELHQRLASELEQLAKAEMRYSQLLGGDTRSTPAAERPTLGSREEAEEEEAGEQPAPEERANKKPAES